MGIEAERTAMTQFFDQQDKLIRETAAKEGMDYGTAKENAERAGARFGVGKESPNVISRTHGYLPIVKINQDRVDRGDRMSSTIRHNRARGKHSVDGMSEIVQELSRRNWSNEKIGKELGMEPDEVLRLKQVKGLAEMFADKEFSEAWESDL
jgi:hypothetical protein